MRPSATSTGSVGGPAPANPNPRGWTGPNPVGLGPGPATPGPGEPRPAAPQPAAPAPTSGPTTGGPAGPGAAPPGPATPRRGTPLVLTHGRTAKELLRIDWDNAVYVPPVQSGATQVPTPATLTPDEAYAYLAGSDERPLLVLRECDGCRGTDLALLRADRPNERTLLLTGFFHCVRLPSHASQPGHPFAALFTAHSHLFLCEADGSGRIDFDGRQSQSDLLKAMRTILDRATEVDAAGVTNRLQKALAQLDRVDAREADALTALEAELDRRGDKSSRVADLQERIRALIAEREEILAEIARLGHRSGG